MCTLPRHFKTAHFNRNFATVCVCCLVHGEDNYLISQKKLKHQNPNVKNFNWHITMNHCFFLTTRNSKRPVFSDQTGICTFKNSQFRSTAIFGDEKDELFFWLNSNFNKLLQGKHLDTYRAYEYMIPVNSKEEKWMCLRFVNKFMNEVCPHLQNSDYKKNVEHQLAKLNGEFRYLDPNSQPILTEYDSDSSEMSPNNSSKDLPTSQDENQVVPKRNHEDEAAVFNLISDINYMVLDYVDPDVEVNQVQIVDQSLSGELSSSQIILNPELQFSSPLSPRFNPRVLLVPINNDDISGDNVEPLKPIDPMSETPELPKQYYSNLGAYGNNWDIVNGSHTISESQHAEKNNQPESETITNAKLPVLDFDLGEFLQDYQNPKDFAGEVVTMYASNLEPDVPIDVPLSNRSSRAHKRAQRREQRNGDKTEEMQGTQRNEQKEPQQKREKKLKVDEQRKSRRISAKFQSSVPSTSSSTGLSTTSSSVPSLADVSTLVNMTNAAYGRLNECTVNVHGRILKVNIHIELPDILSQILNNIALQQSAETSQQSAEASQQSA